MYEMLGAETYLYFDHDGGNVAVRVEADTPIRKGDRVHFNFRPEKIHLFDAQTEEREYRNREKKEKLWQDQSEPKLFVIFLDQYFALYKNIYFVFIYRHSIILHIRNNRWDVTQKWKESGFDKYEFNTADKRIEVYPSPEPDSPIVYINTY